MTLEVKVTPPPDLTHKRIAFALAEDRLGHYPEFRAFFVATFDLARVGLAAPGYVGVEGGGLYQLVFIGRSGEPFPSGLEINAVVDALEPLDETRIDLDLWAILRWAIAGVGAPWSLDDLEQTGRLYRLPALNHPAREG
jgi:hypothetical protein